ncbi:hypothetical protein [Sporosarcina ureilytica]|uniref:Uncharacterized protein n=1 Tax=Sporosarcina ureilytica TaxID=298596 RepID=A0A1D8JGU2_9BACL|nr:hypothetical protein [Sporosarcina ureilytica]AOV07904.1 hypothetical protein BI350_10390 [Sporosarcina ureilytica]
MKKIIFYALLITGIITFIVSFINEDFSTFLLTSGTGLIAWILYLLEKSKEINNKVKYRLIHWKLWIKNPTIDCDFKAEYSIDNEVNLKNIEPVFQNASKIINVSDSQVYFIMDNRKYHFFYEYNKVVLTVPNVPVSYRTLNSYVIKQLSRINENLIKEIQVNNTNYYFTLYHNDNYTHSYIYDFKESLTDEELVYYNFEYEIESKGRVSIDRKRTEIYTIEYASLVDLIDFQI